MYIFHRAMRVFWQMKTNLPSFQGIPSNYCTKDEEKTRPLFQGVTFIQSLSSRILSLIKYNFIFRNLFWAANLRLWRIQLMRRRGWWWWSTVKWRRRRFSTGFLNNIIVSVSWLDEWPLCGRIYKKRRKRFSIGFLNSYIVLVRCSDELENKFNYWLVLIRKISVRKLKKD